MHNAHFTIMVEILIGFLKFNLLMKNYFCNNICCKIILNYKFKKFRRDFNRNCELLLETSILNNFKLEWYSEKI